MASNLTARLKAREPYKHPLGLMLEDLEGVAERTILLGQGDYPTVRRLVMQVVADMAEAADLLAAKDAEIARLTAELDEQARLNGMGAEREAAMRGEVERLTAAIRRQAEVLPTLQAAERAVGRREGITEAIDAKTIIFCDRCHQPVEEAECRDCMLTNDTHRLQEVIATLTAERDAAVVALAQREAQIAELARAAQDVLDETDKMLAIDPPPIKFRAPYGTLARLRGALRSLSPIPADPEEDNG
jgi:hypothetical protein